MQFTKIPQILLKPFIGDRVAFEFKSFSYCTTYTTDVHRRRRYGLMRIRIEFIYNFLRF